MRSVAERIRNAVANEGAWLLLAALAFTGCASTRAMQFGMIATGQPLVSLVVSEDRTVVQQECRGVPASGHVLGCQTSRLIALPGHKVARSVRIVRFTDALPSAMATEIEIHELCHAVAALQGILDPCHDGNNGVLHSALPSSGLSW